MAYNQNKLTRSSHQPMNSERMFAEVASRKVGIKQEMKEELSRLEAAVVQLESTGSTQGIEDVIRKLKAVLLTFEKVTLPDTVGLVQRVADIDQKLEDILSTSEEKPSIPGSKRGIEDILERAYRLKDILSWLDKEKLELETIARLLAELTERLLSGKSTLEDLKSILLNQPITGKHSFKYRRDIYKEERINEKLQENIGIAYTDVWLARLHVCCARLLPVCYDAVDQWLSKHTLTSSIQPARVSSSLVWFVVAVHNWLGWRFDLWRFEDVPTSSPPPIAHEISKRRAEEVDSFLDRLEKSNCRTGDLIAMHVMTKNLRALIRPPGSERVRVSYNDDGISVTKSKTRDSKSKKDPQEMRWQRMRQLNPITRLAQLTIPGSSDTDAQEDLPWHWLDALFNEPAAVDLHQYFSSLLSEWVRHPQTRTEDIYRFLLTLKELYLEVSRDHHDKSRDLEEGWFEFLAQILWSTLDSNQSDTLSLVWSLWICGDNETVPLAQWCGRLAYAAENKAKHTARHRLPEWVWVWKDIAKMTLGHWLVGRGDALLCLGFWIKGYLEDCPDEPPFLLGREAAQQSMGDIVAHWLSICSIASGASLSEHEDPKDKTRFDGQLELLDKELHSFPFVDQCRQEKLIDAPGHEDRPSDITLTLSEITLARVYCCKNE
jgi:hypothetical protein